MCFDEQKEEEEMIPISKKSGVNLVLTCLAYRPLDELSGVLSIGSDVSISVVSLSARQILKISSADLASVATGHVGGSFAVYDADGKRLMNLLLEFDVVDSVPYTSPVREIVCVVPHIPNIGPKSIDTAIDKIVSGKTKIAKLLFVDEDGGQYEVSAITEDGSPTIRVVTTTASP